MNNITGIIVKITGGFYYVLSENDDKLYECKARGIFRKKGCSPLVGDIVDITDYDGEGYCSVDKIHTRKNSLVRPALANLDTLIIVCSVVEPKVNLYILDKMIAASVDKNITPVVVFSKSDLSSAKEYMDIYKKAGILCFEFSSVDNRGLEEIKAVLKDKVTAFSGNTGVGKSTLLNALFPELCLETGKISSKLGRGKHTTRTVELFKKYGGFVADTPGFSTVDLERYEVIKKDRLQDCFPEFSDYIINCKFVSCSHTCEKGCAVIDAVNSGKIPVSRHENYIRMYNEVKDIKDWEHK